MPNADLINDLVFKLNNAFALKDLGDINYFLGIQVNDTTKDLHLSQTKYIIDLLSRAKIREAKAISMPMVHG